MKFFVILYAKYVVCPLLGFLKMTNRFFLSRYWICYRVFWFLGHEACGVLAPWPGIESALGASEGEVLATGLSGKHPVLFQPLNSEMTLMS